MKTVVLFASSFRGERAPNVDHITLDGKKTLCGRTGWQTEEGWDARLDDPEMPGEVGCRGCAAGYARVRLETSG